MSKEKLIAVANHFGGFRKFAKRMGASKGFYETVRTAAAGTRIPSAKTRRAMVAASEGMLTEADIISITGKEKASYAKTFEVDSQWEMDDDDRRAAISRRAAEGVRRTIEANKRLPPP